MTIKLFTRFVIFALVDLIISFAMLKLFPNNFSAFDESDCIDHEKDEISYECAWIPNIGFEPILPDEEGGGEASRNEYDTFLEAYFANLTNNFGYNEIGSCGYIAMGMLLSYYDTYLNDEIIADQYEKPSTGGQTNMNLRKNSPGILCEDYMEYPEGLSEKEKISYYYYNFVIPAYKNSLHAKLIKMGADYFNYYDFNSEHPCGLTMSNMVNLLDKYLLLDVGYKRDIDYFYKYSRESDQEDISNFIISEIDEGYPVILGISNDSKAHACIAYAHKEIGLICHTGYLDGKSSYVALKNTAYKNIDFALSLHICKEHSHTDNYKVGGNSYCYCSHDIISYKNLHEYTQSYIDNGNGTHKAYCSCGAYITEDHTYNNHYLKYSSSDYHYAYCGCGQRITQAHSWVAFNFKNSTSGAELMSTEQANPMILSTKVQCRKCGFIKTLKDDEFIPVPVTGNNNQMFSRRKDDE